MESVATCTPPTSSCSTTINQLLHNAYSRKDLIKELLADNDFHREIVESLDSIKPPILNQASYNNSIVNWKDTARHYPVDENALSVYSHGTRIGQPLPSSKSAAKAKGYAKRKVIKSLLNAGTFEQQRCVLLHVLSDPKVLDRASSIGVNILGIQMSQQVLRCAKKLILCAKDTDNNNFRVSSKRRAVSQAITVALLPTPTKDDSNDRKRPMISTRALSKLLCFPTSAGHRIITKALKKCEAISKSNADWWIMIDNDDKCTKYSDKLHNDIEAWMQDNDMIHFNPSKGDTIIKCDRD
jgi:hypothetical protein